MATIGIIIGSTRPNRRGEQVAAWVHQEASRRGDAKYELVDLRDYPLPHLDEPMPASSGQYQHDHTREWAARIDSLDGFVIVTPEYNHSVPGVLKNAIDYLYAEWNDKAVGFVSYGGAGGVRAVEHLRPHRRRVGSGRRPRPGDAVLDHRVRELQRLQTRRLQPRGPEHNAGSTRQVDHGVGPTTQHTRPGPRAPHF
jgi:NAD(P)H-dependent FMN reductase